MEGYQTEPVVRVPWNEPVIVKRILDMGAQTILYPFVQNAEEAKAAVESGTHTLKEGISKEEAEAMKAQLEAVGGKVELE